MKTVQLTLGVLALLAILPLTQAQSVPTNGTPLFNTFSGGPDVINEGNLNIHFTIPVFSRAGVGLPFSQSLPVDNGTWYRYQDLYANWHWGADFSTAQPGGMLVAGGVFYTTTPLRCARDGTDYNKYIATSYTGPDSTSHAFSPYSFLGPTVFDYNCTGSQPSTATGTSIDGSGITLSISVGGYAINATVTLTDGTVITPPIIDSSGTFHGSGNYAVKDANNNTISVYAPSPPQISYILDTLGSEPITSTGGPPPTAVKYSYTAPSGAQAWVTVSYETVTIQSAWGCTGTAEYPATNHNLINTITLPDGTYYQFFYEATYPGSGNTTGRITQVHLPTGGSISYTYTGGDTNKGIVCADGSTSGLSRTGPASVTYSRTINSIDPNWPSQVDSSTTQITDSGNVTSVDFWRGVETQRRMYEGPATGTPLQTVITCYNGTDPINPSTCPGATVTQPFTRVSTFRSLNGGSNSRSDTFYNNYGLVTKRDAYDWGASSYTQETQINYDSTLGDGIVDHPSTVKVVDGAANLKSETDYSYDDFAISGDTKTCAPATKCRGNLTKLTKYASSSTGFTTQMTYNLNGTLATSLDANGIATTTFTYGSGSCGPLPSQTKVTAGSITLTTSDTYNCTGTVRKSHTDANNQVSSASYTTDPYFWRPESTKDELLNTTTYSYSGQTVAESAMTFNASRSTVDSLDTKDTFGRPAYSQKRQGVGNSYFDSVQQVYDSGGRPYESSMPYQGTAGHAPTSPIYSTTLYDGADRATQMEDGGGGILNTSYSQNDVYQEIAPAPSGSTENTKRKQLEYDGLGRMTSVCEVTGGQSSGPCGQSTGGYSGYLTAYTYNAAPNLPANSTSLTVNQNSQSGGGTSQTRIYIYDMLGRLTYESNPETKVNNYYYDSLSADANCGTVSFPGDLVKTVDQKGIVACFSYDGIHRLLSVTYSAGPSKYFVYDSATLSGVTLYNTIGRLAEAYTCTGTCASKTTDIFFSYSARGEVADVYESTPHSSGYNHVSANYWPHGVLSSLAVPNVTSLPTIYYGASDGSGLDGEGRITKVTAGTSTNLASGVTYTTSGNTQPIGSLTAMNYGSNDSDTFSYDTLTGRLTGYTFKMNSLVAKSGSLTWNANGSLKQLALTDNLNTGNSQTCSYSQDDLARIASVNCVQNSTTVWGQTFGFDPFGNITKNATVGITFTPTYNMATNRYTALPGCTPTYDGDGDLTNDCTHTYTWQGDGSVSKVDLVSLTYDALGRVVEQKNGTVYTQVLYSPSGGKLALMNGATVVKAFLPLPGGGTAVYSSTGLTYYRHADWLGSSRLASTPTAPTSVYADAEYAPYGEPYGASGNADFNFTGQNQDTVSGTISNPSSGLYDFLFREYNPQHGRWISPDPAGFAAVNLASPQTWNRYAYVRNGPLNQVDPMGLNPNTSKYGDCIGCNPYMHSPGDKGGWDYSIVGTSSEEPDGGSLALGISPSGALDVGDFSGFSETTEIQTMTTVWSYSVVPANVGSGPSGPTKTTTPANIKQKICSAIPSGRTTGTSGGVGGVGSTGGGGELVVNYNSGQVSAFGFGGVQVGWNGGLSGSLYSGFVWGLNNSNSNYSGGFTGVNGGAGLGGFAASSSGGLTGGPSGLIPNPRGVTAGGVSLGAGLLGGFSGGVTATNYTNPAQLGKFWAFSPLDWVFYLARKGC